MKTKELIEQLKENDPSGELEVCVDNLPIYFVDVLPAYWDGRLQCLIQDHSKDPYYNIVGYRITSNGDKLNLRTMDLGTVLLDNPEAVVELDLDSMPSEKPRWEKIVEKERKEARTILRDVCLESIKEDSGNRWEEFKKNRDLYQNDMKVKIASFPTDDHPAYQRIIKMKAHAIPFLLYELKEGLKRPEGPNHWFTALSVIMGKDRPEIPEEARGRIVKMAEIWIKWGEEKGYA